jgi:hypothetical protein
MVCKRSTALNRALNWQNIQVVRNKWKIIALSLWENQTWVEVLVRWYIEFCKFGPHPAAKSRYYLHVKANKTAGMQPTKWSLSLPMLFTWIIHKEHIWRNGERPQRSLYCETPSCEIFGHIYFPSKVSPREANRDNISGENVQVFLLSPKPSLLNSQIRR